MDRLVRLQEEFMTAPEDDLINAIIILAEILRDNDCTARDVLEDIADMLILCE